MSSSIEYVYCVAPATLGAALSRLPDGMDEAPVRAVACDDLVALATAVDARTYAPDAIEQRAGDVSWVGDRAVAHDRVITWASDRGATVPLPMWTLFSDDAAIIAALRVQGPVLRAALERVRDAREYTVRIFADAA